MPSPKKTAADDRLDWVQLRSYWEGHAKFEGKLDLENDPDALGNVVWPGQPLWLNRHLAGMQLPVYRELLALAAVRPGMHALDVGCGSGRWVRELLAGDLVVTGIDLQSALVDLDKLRYPNAEFMQTALQDLPEDSSYDIVSSVTVLQHNPPDQQVLLAQKMKSLLRTGGHALILENVHDQASHTFGRSVEDWKNVFEKAGFVFVRSIPYDWSPFLRIALRARRWKPRAGRRVSTTDRAPQMDDASRQRIKHLVLRSAVALDGPIETLGRRFRLHSGHVHCGFLFRAE